MNRKKKIGKSAVLSLLVLFGMFTLNGCIMGRHVTFEDVKEHLEEKFGDKVKYTIQKADKPRTWNVTLETYPELPFQVYECNSPVLPILFLYQREAHDTYIGVFKPIYSDSVIVGFISENQAFFDAHPSIELTGNMRPYYKFSFSRQDDADSVFVMIEKLCNYLLENPKNKFVSYSDINIEYSYQSIRHSYIGIKDGMITEHGNLAEELSNIDEERKRRIMENLMDTIGDSFIEQHPGFSFESDYYRKDCIVKYTFSVDNAALDSKMKEGKAFCEYLVRNCAETPLEEDWRIKIGLKYTWEDSKNEAQATEIPFAEIHHGQIIFQLDSTEVQDEILRKRRRRENQSLSSTNE